MRPVMGDAWRNYRDRNGVSMDALYKESARGKIALLNSR